MSLLFDFRPLVINPKLAERIGLNEAIVLQQLKYWLSETDAGVEHEGRQWIYNTLEQWQKQFPFWSPETVKRTLSSLQKQGLVLVEKLAKARHDQTNYYTINYESPDLLDQVKLTRSDEVKLTSSSESGCSVLHTEITTKTSHEINQGAGRPAVPRPKVKSARFDPLTAKPANVSQKAWADFCDMRKAKRSPLTKRACEMIATKLASHSDPDAVLDKSTLSCWTDIYPESVLPGAGAQPARTGQQSAVLHVPTHTQEMYPNDLF